MKVCSKCKESKPFSEFSKKRNGLQSYCKECNQVQKRAWYIENREEERKRLIANKIRSQNVNQEFVAEYLLNNPCNRCSENNILALEFHHHGNDKEHNISTLIFWMRNRKT